MIFVKYRRRTTLVGKLLLAAFLICLSTANRVSGQSTYNPYEAMSSQFRNFSRPGGMNPFNTMSGNRSQSNSFQEEMDRFFGGRETTSGLSRDRDRYYNAFRKYDEEFDRLYRPNQDVDRVYNERRNSRESDYFKAFREKNPKRRAELMRSFDRGENLAAIRDDSKPEEKSSAARRSSTTKGRGDDRSLLPRNSRSSSPAGGTRSGGLLDSSRSSSNSTGERASSGLLDSRDSRDSKLGSSSEGSSGTRSLTERSGRLSEEFRPSSPTRGYGPFRSREEMLKDERKNSSAGKDSSLVPDFFP